jgi:hypothetical protein
MCGHPLHSNVGGSHAASTGLHTPTKASFRNPVWVPRPNHLGQIFWVADAKEVDLRGILGGDCAVLGWRAELVFVEHGGVHMGISGSHSAEAGGCPLAFCLVHVYCGGFLSFLRPRMCDLKSHLRHSSCTQLAASAPFLLGW